MPDSRKAIVAAAVKAVDTDMKNVGAAPELRASCAESVQRVVGKSLDDWMALSDNDTLT
jgi:hypothetical protein